MEFFQVILWNFSKTSSSTPHITDSLNTNVKTQHNFWKFTAFSSGVDILMTCLWPLTLSIKDMVVKNASIIFNLQNVYPIKSSSNNIPQFNSCAKSNSWVCFKKCQLWYCMTKKWLSYDFYNWVVLQIFSEKLNFSFSNLKLLVKTR